jgi:putative oxidoreductase
MQPALMRFDAGLAIAGKVLIASLFWWSAFNGLSAFADVVSFVAGGGFPFPHVVAAGAVGLEIIAPAVLFVPRLEVWAALALALYCLLTAIFFHNYWTLIEPDRFTQQVNFFKNLALAGALLINVARDRERKVRQ